jgi:hypothetical protein
MTASAPFYDVPALPPDVAVQPDDQPDDESDSFRVMDAPPLRPSWGQTAL